MTNKSGRIKKWVQYNKAVVISFMVVLIYTLIMLCIIYGFGFKLTKCSSGTLTDIDHEEVEIQTSMHRPEN